MNNKTDAKALQKISYGLFLLITNDGKRDNACIINTVMQITADPLKIAVAVNKSNYTHDTLKTFSKFNISILDESATFELFERFGFISGKDNDKFDGYTSIKRSSNSLCYDTAHSNAYISATVENMVDIGTHTVFIASVDEAQILSDINSVTYDYYFKNIKPKKNTDNAKKGYVCKICGYVYEGDELPKDYICPLCKHGAEDFEPLN